MNTKALLEPMGSWAWWRSWFLIFLGCSIMGAGFVLFVNPYNFVPGGVYGMGIVLHNIFPSIQVGTFGYMFDVPLMLTAMLVFGGQFGTRTVLAALYTPGFMNMLTRWSILPTPRPSRVSIRRCSLWGPARPVERPPADVVSNRRRGQSVNPGIGRRRGAMQATTGGTDIVAMLLTEVCRHQVSRPASCLADGFVVLSVWPSIGFGLGTGDAASNGWLRTALIRSSTISTSPRA